MSEPQSASSWSAEAGEAPQGRGAPARARFRYEASPAPAYPLPPQAERFRGHPLSGATAGAGDTASGPVGPRRPAVSLVASVLVPGLGTVLNGQVGKGAALLGAYAACWLGLLLLGWIVVGLVFLPAAVAVWAYGLYDAYQGAEDWNARHQLTASPR